MNPFQTRGLNGVAILALALLSSAAAAQVQPVQSYQVGRPASSYQEDPGTALARYLSALNGNPNDLSALIGAGNAAVDVGDIPGASALFSRAEAVSPRDGRIKAGMGSVMVLSEQPQAALSLFAEAASLGVPAQSFAADRGLAHDMMGDQGAAQADYTLALRGGSDPEVERRMALSKAISGDRNGALSVLEPQIRMQDRAGWRARAFVLALTGDVQGARKAVSAVMPAQAAAMDPFLMRLPQLGPADRAMAVHFGRFPAEGTQLAVAPPTTHPTQIARVEPAKARSPGRRTITEPSTAQPERRDYDLRARRADAMGLPRSPASAPRPVITEAPPQRVPEPEPVAIAAVVPEPAPAQIDTRPIVAATLAPSSATGTVRAPGPQYEAPGPQYELPAARAAAAEPARSRLADVAAAIAALPDVVEVDVPPVVKKPAPAPAKIAAAKAAKAEPKTPPKEKASPKKAPEAARIWVQLASGANKAALPAEYKRIAAKAPKVLGGKTAWTAPSRASNRLLIGPFKTDKEARDIVNELAKANVNGFSWSSEAGEEIAKLAVK